MNTGKYTGNNNLEQTVFKVNKEATTEIAKQLRLRDIGGIIIIDYIDMHEEENKKEIEELKKYFYFCDFPEGGVEQIYYRYGKNTEDYIRNHSMGKILDNIKPVNN